MGALSAFMASCSSETKEIESLEATAELTKSDIGNNVKYKIRNVNSLKNLQTAGSSKADGVNIIQASINDNLSQIWKFYRTVGSDGATHYRILNTCSWYALYTEDASNTNYELK